MCRTEKVEAKNQAWLSGEEQGRLYSKVPVRQQGAGEEKGSGGVGVG